VQQPGPRPGDTALQRRLQGAVRGEVRFDRFTRGLYSTDASHYQIEPLGVVFPRDATDVSAILEVSREEGVPVLPRGAGTSQCGQTVGRAVVVDVSRHLSSIALDEEGNEVVVEPGVVLDELNRRLAPAHKWFPVDPSTSNRATLGGMAGNNSAGARSLRYGMMVDNVAAIEVVLPDGRKLWLGEGGDEEAAIPSELRVLRALYEREADEIRARAPRTLRNVAGYNLDRLAPEKENLAQLLVGSEGTLAFFTRLRLRLSELPARRVVGVCHFPDLLKALDAVQHIVELGPSAVELVDENVLALAMDRPVFRDPIQRFVIGAPKALLLVEFASDTGGAGLERRLDDLVDTMGRLGFPGGVVRAEDPGLQAEIWAVRKAGLNLVMSMAGPRKPVSFLEDCAVPLEHLSEYARRVEEIFRRHDTLGTWYAHASVGCLHVRPALNLKDPADLRRMRRIAEEAHEVVRAFKGTHSGEHGDGILRSEFLEPMLGRRLVGAFREVKRTFDPGGVMNPGKIVDPPRMDDRSLLRYAPEYAPQPLPVVLDWPGTEGFLAHIERCNNNGACLKSDPGVMCPSYRATRDERHSTRGRANALRLAVTGQLGPQALASPEMSEAMGLCVSCKACKRECPTGVDMARLKLEWLHQRNRLRGIPVRERLLAGLPRVAPLVSQAATLANRIAGHEGTRELAERALGLTADRPLPEWSASPWSEREISTPHPDVLLFVDTFTRWFEPHVARAAAELLGAGGWQVGTPRARRRPLCCGRTWLSSGMVDRARREAERLVAALAPAAREGIPIVGLEPSCLFTLKDEVPALVASTDADMVGEHAQLLEELLERWWNSGHQLPLRNAGDGRIMVHGHCHQKAFGATTSTLDLLRRIPGAQVSEIHSGCCGMAGAFGYQADHQDVSFAMGELSLFPAVRGAGEDVTLVADGTSCRAQIRDGTGRTAEHAAMVLRRACITT